MHEWLSGYDPDMAAEPVSRVSWEIEPQEGGYCLLTGVHDKLDGSSRTARNVAGPGWTFVLSNLKSVLETGTPLGA